MNASSRASVLADVRVGDVVAVVHGLHPPRLIAPLTPVDWHQLAFVAQSLMKGVKQDENAQGVAIATSAAAVTLATNWSHCIVEQRSASGGETSA